MSFHHNSRTAVFFGKYIIMKITAIIFRRRGLIKEIEEKDDIKLLEITRINKGYLSLEILKEIGMGVSDLRVCLIIELMSLPIRGIEVRKPHGPSSSIMKKLKWLQF